MNNNHPHTDVVVCFDHHNYQDFKDRMEKAMAAVKPQTAGKQYITEPVKFLPWRTV